MAVDPNSPIQEHLKNMLTSGNPDGLKEWIAEEMNRKNESGLTALHRATKDGKKQVIECLIQFGANVNAKCEREEIHDWDDGWPFTKGSTPLHGAVRMPVSYKLETAQYLLDHGADPNATDELGATPLHDACAVMDRELKGPGDLRNVPQNLGILKLLLEKGANVNAISTDDRINEGRFLQDCVSSPIHEAVRLNNGEFLEILLENGAIAEPDTNLLNGRFTPLQAACFVVAGEFPHHINLKIFDLLIDHGANPDTKDQDGNTCLHQFCGAVLNFEPDDFPPCVVHKLENLDEDYLFPYIKFLVERGARIDILNNNNETPFFLANRNNYKVICEYLLKMKREEENQIPEETFSTKAPCIVCLHPRNGLYVLNPCGHTSLCETCSYRITKERHPKCPSCRKPATSYTKLYFQAAEEGYRD